MATGIFNTSQFTTDHAAKSFAGMITRLMPNGSAPLFGMTAQLQSETAVAVEHGFFTKTMLFPEMTLNGAIADGTVTTFTVTSTANILPGMIMRADSTGENIIVNSILSATQFTCNRGVGTVAAAAIADTVKLFQVGNAYEEASSRPGAQQVQPVRITNLTQIFRNTWTISDTVRATQVIAGETNIAESRQDCAAFHAADIEKALFFGQKSSGTRNGQPFRTMDGLISIVGNSSYYPPAFPTPNVTTLGATTTFTQLEAALDPVFNQATDPKVANERVLFVGGTAKKVLNNIGRLNGTYQLVDGLTSYGLQFSTFKTARGTFRTIEHPLLNTNSSWAKMGIAVDLSSFRIAYLGDRKTKNEEFGVSGEVADNGQDAVGGTLTTEMTCVVKNPPANAILYNFTAAAQG
jgi:hypothetical protein